MPFAPFPISLRQLQYLVAVAETGSFRAAAEACHVAQPSLSAQVAQAEGALGIAVFERDRRGVIVTDAGAVFLVKARTVLAQSTDLMDLARELGDPYSGALRVGVIPTIAPYLLPDVAPLLRAQYPRLELVWTEEKTATIVERLERAELHAGVVALESELGDLPHIVLGRDPFVVAVAEGHRLAHGARALSSQDLDGERVYLLDDGHCFRTQSLSFCARAGANEAEYRATSLSTLVQLAASGHGVTLLPAMALDVENRRGSLCVRNFGPRGPARTIAFAWRRGSSRKAALQSVGATLRAAYATRSTS
jgi:LysR family hydrogen peroxide-inducible transcriptional activator